MLDTPSTLVSILNLTTIYCSNLEPRRREKLCLVGGRDTSTAPVHPYQAYILLSIKHHCSTAARLLTWPRCGQPTFDIRLNAKFKFAVKAQMRRIYSVLYLFYFPAEDPLPTRSFIFEFSFCVRFEFCFSRSIPHICTMTIRSIRAI